MDAAQAARHFAETLERASVPYAVGGAIAYGFFGTPRGTYDVDLNLFVPPEHAAEVVEVLRAAGLDLDTRAAVASAGPTSGGGWWRRWARTTTA